MTAAAEAPSVKPFAVRLEWPLQHKLIFRYKKENFSSHLAFRKNGSSLVTIFRDDDRCQIVVQLLNAQINENIAELKRNFRKFVVFQPGSIPS